MYPGGKPINPRKLKSVSAAPISKTNMADYGASITPLIARLEGGETPSRAQLAESAKSSVSESSVN
jgi:hypothetical protein